MTLLRSVIGGAQAAASRCRRERTEPLRALERTLAASLISLGLGLSGAAAASADPESTAPIPDPITLTRPIADMAATPAAAACRRFGTALRVSSVYYNDFAYAIAGNGAFVDYQDPKVRTGNVDGRTALRQAAGEARGAASTPGVPPEIADPMRSWSWQAMKLVLTMGLRGDGDTLNNAAADLNELAESTQLACASGGQP